jgi:flagellar basal-body rod protein FlgF
MDSIALAAAAGLRSRMDALDMLSNNLANVSTSGYKADREFYTLFQGEDATLSLNGLEPATLPQVKSQWTDLSQGLLQPTGNPLDVALTGKGFFAVNGPSGPLYTRNGAFKLSASGQLITSEGYAVRGQGGVPIKATSQTPIQISPTGTVQQDGQTLGQLEVVDFANTTALNKVGSSYFRVTDPAVKPAPVLNASVEQGQIEASNVSPAESAVRLVELSRQYQMLQKAVSITAEMDKSSTDVVARVSA